jgi:O-antigen/teichoic acid export membrane protein
VEIISFDTQGSAIAKNAFWGFLLQVLLKFKGVILLPIVVHFLSRDVLGEWKLITTTVSVLLPIISLNLFDGSGMFFSSDVDKVSVRKKYYSVFNLALILEAASLLLCIAVTWLFKEIDARFMLMVFVYFAAMYNYKMGIMLLQTYQKSRFLMILNLTAEYGGFLLSLALIALGYRNVIVLLAPPVILYTSLSVFMFFRIGKEIPYWGSIDRDFLRTTLPVSLSLLPVYLAEWVLMAIGVYALNHFYGEGEVGFYSVLTSLASLTLALRATLQFFWFSTCSNMIRNGDSQFPRYFHMVFKVYLLLIVIAVLLYAGFSRELILIMAKEEYLPIEKDLYVVVLGNCLMVLSCIWNGIMYARGEGVKITTAYLAAGVVAVVLSPLLSQRMGILGAALSYLVANATLFGVMLRRAGNVGLTFSPGERRFGLVLLLPVGFCSVLVAAGVPHLWTAIACGVSLVLVLVLNETTGFIPLRSVASLFERKGI